MRAVAVLLSATLFAACGGGTHTGSGALTCESAGPYGGPPLHAALPANTFPSAHSGSASNAALPGELGLLLDARLKEIVLQTGAPAVAVAVDVPGLGRWTSTQGLARVTPPEPASEATLFYWGSVAKPLTAVLVLQLVEEGKLNLDDRLARWYPQMPQADLITIEHLLTHTSGLATNALGLDPISQAPAAPAEQVLAASRTPSVFCPGTGASYSNTGYWILGLIVEAIEGQAFHEVLQRRIAGPLGLQQLRALRPGEEQPTDLASPHQKREPQADAGAWSRIGAGNVVAGADDMLSFWQAVLTGRLLPLATVQRQWSRLYPMQSEVSPPGGQALSWYGQGVAVMEWTDEQGRIRPWLGHLGSIPTANAAVLYDPLVGAYVAVAVNSEVSSAAAANALLQVVMDWQMGRLLAHASRPRIAGSTSIT
jgi:D-alanyl-D-alanine carboxypeptidase